MVEITETRNLKVGQEKEITTKKDEEDDRVSAKGERNTHPNQHLKKVSN